MLHIITALLILISLELTKICAHGEDDITYVNSIIEKLNNEKECLLPTYQEVDRLYDIFNGIDASKEAYKLTDDQKLIKETLLDRWPTFRKRVHSVDLIKAAKLRSFLCKIEAYQKAKTSHSVCTERKPLRDAKLVKYIFQDIVNGEDNDGEDNREQDDDSLSLIHRAKPSTSTERYQFDSTTKATILDTQFASSTIDSLYTEPPVTTPLCTTTRPVLEYTESPASTTPYSTQDSSIKELQDAGSTKAPLLISSTTTENPNSNKLYDDIYQRQSWLITNEPPYGYKSPKFIDIEVTGPESTTWKPDYWYDRTHERQTTFPPTNSDEPEFARVARYNPYEIPVIIMTTRSPNYYYDRLYEQRPTTTELPEPEENPYAIPISVRRPNYYDFPDSRSGWFDGFGAPIEFPTTTQKPDLNYWSRQQWPQQDSYYSSYGGGSHYPSKNYYQPPPGLSPYFWDG